MSPILRSLQRRCADWRTLQPRRAYLEQLWAAHDWLEREILKVERTYTDKQLDRMLERD